MRLRWFLLLLALSGCVVNPAERNNAANWYYAQGDYRTALRAYELAQVNAPDAPEPYYNAASALAAMERWQSAIAALEQAQRSGDEALTAASYFNMGNIYYDAALYDEALAAYQQALRLDPLDADARYNYELVLRRLPQEQESEPTPDGADPTATPTPESGDTGETTPTPPAESTPDVTQPPVAGDAGGQGELRSTPTPQPEGPLTMEDVERQLEAVEQDQRTLSEFFSVLTPPAPPAEREW